MRRVLSRRVSLITIDETTRSSIYRVRQKVTLSVFEFPPLLECTKHHIRNFLFNDDVLPYVYV